VAQHKNSGLSGLTVEVPKSNTIRHRHQVGLLWASDQLVAEAAICTTHNKYKRRTSMPSAGFEPAIPAIKRQQIPAFDGTAVGISWLLC